MRLCEEKINNSLNKFITTSEEETRASAKKFATTLKGGEVLLLKGDLGAGKTAFAKGLADAFGVEEIVTSPTFTILNEHYGKTLNLYHFDMYRIDDESELKELGFDEYIDSDGICVIEWSNFIKQLLPSELLNIEINILENDYRQLIFIAYGEKYERIVKQLCTL